MRVQRAIHKSKMGHRVCVSFLLRCLQPVRLDILRRALCCLAWPKDGLLGSASCRTIVSAVPLGSRLVWNPGMRYASIHSPAASRTRSSSATSLDLEDDPEMAAHRGRTFALS